MNAMLLMMGGTGSRFGAKRPKQYTLIDGRPLFSYIIQKTELAKCVDRLIIVSHADWLDYVQEWCDKTIYDLPYDIVAGGRNRSESVLHGLTCLEQYAAPTDVVLIHDVTHPYIDIPGIQAVIDGVNECGGATLASKNYDTVYRTNGEGYLEKIEPRDYIVAGASPEAFRFADIYKIYKEASEEELASMTSAGAIALSHNIPMKVVPASLLNLKITYHNDMDLFRALKDTYFFSDLNAEQLYRDQLITLHEFDRFCKDFEIPYFAIGETLVGAIYYHRLIPGKVEGDMNVAMMRPDFEKFLTVLKDNAKKYSLSSNLSSYGKLEMQIHVSFSRELPNSIIKKRTYGTIVISCFDLLPDDGDEMHFIKNYAHNHNDRLMDRYGMLSKPASKGLWGLFVKNYRRRRYTKDSNLKYFRKFDKGMQRYAKSKHAHSAGCMIGHQSKVIALDKLFPLKEVPFGDMTIPAPKDTTMWAEPMTPELEHRIHTIQKVDLMIMKEFDRVCRQIGVGYFLCGGTMLGYVRHNGFIPWDDDVDCGMLRADYDKFLKEAPKYLNDRFFLQTRESDPMIPYLFSKLRMNDTEYVTNYNKGRKFHKGICLDIFPFDVLPDSPSEQEHFVALLHRLSTNHNAVANRQRADVAHTFAPENLSQLWHRIEFKVHRELFKKYDLNQTQKKYIDTATKYNNRKTTVNTEVASFVPTYTHVRLGDLLPYQDITFEGVPAMLMNRPEVFLEMQYGNYLSVPPVHSQMGHDLVKWSADIPEMKEWNELWEKEHREPEQEPENQ